MEESANGGNEDQWVCERKDQVQKPYLQHFEGYLAHLRSR